MRRCHLRGHKNILKRQLIHVGAFNLSLILRKLVTAGTPREWKNRGGMLLLFFLFAAHPPGNSAWAPAQQIGNPGQNTSREHEVEYAAGAVANTCTTGC
jgi:hypothetical protein